MKKDQIRFIWALGSHGTYDALNARKKLGDEIVENYAVYNHDPFQNVVRIGRTPTGVELWFSREFMACDLKIGIGGAVAHPQAGFGGGAKIILPGVAGIESIVQLHNQLDRDTKRWGFGLVEDNIMAAECDAAGDLAGLNFKVDCLLNRRGEISSLYAGPFKAVREAAAAEAIDYYGIPYADGYDIAVANCYGKANEPFVAQAIAAQILKRDASGTIVIVCDSPEGIVPHYVYRSWGTGYGGRHYIPRVKGAAFKRIKQFIMVAPYPDRTMLDIMVHNDDAIIVKTWPEALSVLEAEYSNDARVGVVQDATMQYLKKAAVPKEELAASAAAARS
jgi:nickel-dependent lactate racemase